MRFESKHRYFKQIARVMNNYKNVAKYRHQRHMCYLHAFPSNYLKHQVVNGPGILHSATCTCASVFLMIDILA